MRVRRLVLPLALVALLAAAVVSYLAVTGFTTARVQSEMLTELDSGAAPQPVKGQRSPDGRPRTRPVASSVEVGDPLAVLEIPRFGTDWKWAVVEGTDDAQLDDGPGHYPGTPLPGDVGNVALAGHRAGHGSPFLDFDELEVGDEVRIRQGDLTWVYHLTGRPEIIGSDEDWVLDALPGRQLTLTTCWPKYGSAKRMYVRGALDRVERGA